MRLYTWKTLPASNLTVATVVTTIFDTLTPVVCPAQAKECQQTFHQTSETTAFRPIYVAVPWGEDRAEPRGPMQNACVYRAARLQAKFCGVRGVACRCVYGLTACACWFMTVCQRNQAVNFIICWLEPYRPVILTTTNNNVFNILCPRLCAGGPKIAIINEVFNNYYKLINSGNYIKFSAQNWRYRPVRWCRYVGL